MLTNVMGWPVVLYCVVISQNTYLLEDMALSDFSCNPLYDAFSV